MSPVQLSSVDRSYTITHQLTYLIDSDGALTPEQVRSDQSLKWHTNSDEPPNFGITSDVYWWRFQLTNALSYNDWLLVMHYPLIDQIDLYVELNGSEGPPLVHKFGDSYTFDQRAISHRQFITQLDIPQGETATVYMRLASESPIQGPVKIWPNNLFFTSDQTHVVRQGFYYGGMIIMALFNLIIFFMAKDKNYFYYATFVIFQAMFQAGIHGFGFQYLWPNLISFQQISSILALNISMGFAGLFFDDLLQLRKHNPKASKVVRVVAIFLLIQAVAIWFVPYIWALRISILSVAFLSLSSVAISRPLYAKGIVEAKFFIWGWSVMIVGGILMALDKYGIMSQNLITANAFQIGSIIQVLLLSAAIANRINTERKRILITEQHALKVERDAKENLEKKVLERTQELEILNQKLNKLSRTDALTGVMNRRAFDEIYQAETAYCFEHQMPLAILILDIDHFKKINDNYGHESGDECLRFVGQLLTESLNGEYLYITRYGGEEFVIAIRGMNHTDALKEAESLREIIENTPLDANGNTINITASIGVASSIPQQQGETRLFHLADKALYKAKNNGRNQVRLSYS